MTITHVLAPMTATVVELCVAQGDAVVRGQRLAIVEAMKMEHELHAAADGRVAAIRARAGELVNEGEVLLELAPRGASTAQTAAAAPAQNEPTAERADLLALRERLALVQDAARPQAVARRHDAGARTARENVADLCDDGSFVEIGALAYAAQERRRPRDELIRQTPADGLVCGIGSIDGERCAVLAYDATVLAGTQGFRNHQKLDRMFALAQAQRLPLVLFAEGGGGRPGDTDMPIVAGLHGGAFAALARLSGQVPLVGIVAGRCFAGNAALLGCCDVVIATRDANIGMGGPAMVEGGGLGRFAPQQIGPAAEQARNGVVDVLVDDEAQAVEVARRYLAFLRGRASEAVAPDTSKLRDALPAQRNRVYDMRALLRGIVDRGSLLELREGFGAAVITALARLDGRAIGLVASNPAVIGGAIDADAADKLARFWQLCDAHGLPVVSLIDTPGFLVGPEAESRAQVRHSARLFVNAARLRVPLLAVVVRRGFGLGAMALAGGSFHVPVAICAWPSGEFGAMGLEGAVRLGYRKELEAEPEGLARQALFDRLLAQHVEAGQAVHMAETLEIDAVIDPADTRDWLCKGLAAAKVDTDRAPRFIDAW